MQNDHLSAVTVMKPGAEAYRRAIELIEAGNIIIIPTYTIYVLVCDAFNKGALDKLRAIRFSPPDKPLTLVMNLEQVEEYAVVDDRQKRIISLFFPSAVSMYVKKKDERLNDCIAGSESLVVYNQDSEIGQLHQLYGRPLAISSSNFKGLPDARTVAEAIEYFSDQVSLYIDGGPPRGNKPSAHIDIRKEPIVSMREAPHYPFSEIQALLALHGLR